MATRSKTPVQQQRPHSALTIDHNTYLLPFAAGQKVMELMAGAVRVDKDLSRDGGLHWQFNVQPEPVRVEMELVQPDQVVMPRNESAEPAAQQIRRLK